MSEPLLGAVQEAVERARVSHCVSVIMLGDQQRPRVPHARVRCEVFHALLGGEWKEP